MTIININRVETIVKNGQYYKFSMYGFLKNLRFFDAFFILFLIEKGLSFTQIGVLYAVREITINVSELPSGIIADTFGRKKSLVASFFLYIVSFLIFYFSNAFVPFLAAFVFYGIADAFRSGTHKGMIMDYLRLNNRQDQKIAYYGHTRSWSHLGSALSSLIAGGIVFYSGAYDKIFLYSIVPYVINLVLILSYPKDISYSHNDKKTGRPGMVLVVKTFFNSLRRPKVLGYVNTAAAHTAFLKAVKDYIQPVMVSIALLLPFLTNVETEKKSGIVIGVIYFLIFLLNSYASKKSGLIASKSKGNLAFVTMVAGLLLGLACGILIDREFWVISLVAFVGIYVVENVRKPILTGYIADHVPNEILTSVISAQSLLKTLLTALFALAFGFFADRDGIGMAFVIVSAFVLAGSVLLNVLTQKRS